MLSHKVDPRVLRTRKLIMDSFIKLSNKKEFHDITVKDITEEAMINRTTFYYHFEDKYDLLEKTLSEVLQVNLSTKLFEDSELNEDMITKMFLALTTLQESLPKLCNRQYEQGKTVDHFVRDQLEIILYKTLLKKQNNKNKQSIKTISVMLSWAIYGSSIDWKNSKEPVPPEDYIQLSMPYILNGIKSIH